MLEKLSEVEKHATLFERTFTQLMADPVMGQQAKSLRHLPGAKGKLLAQTHEMARDDFYETLNDLFSTYTYTY